MDKKRPNEIRKLSLEHWFVNHQLAEIRKTHFHLPGTCDVNVTAIAHQLIASGLKPHSLFTSVTVKAVGLALEALPEANCVYMSTPFGPRLIRPNSIAVNLPIQIQHDTGKILTVEVIQSPNTKTVTQIRDEIRRASESGLDKNPVARFLVGRANTWYNRLILRGLSFLAYRIPQLYLKFGAGGGSVSSLIRQGGTSIPLTTVSFGPTAFTVIINSLWQEADQWFLRLGIGFDHMAAPGEMAVIFSKQLAAIFSGNDKALHHRLCDFSAEESNVNFRKDSSIGLDL